MSSFWEKLVNSLEDVHIELDSKTLSLLKQHQDLIVGFRSEDLKIHLNQTPNSVLGKIANIELIGKDQLIAVSVNKDIEFIVNAPNDQEFELYQEV